MEINLNSHINSSIIDSRMNSGSRRCSLVPSQISLMQNQASVLEEGGCCAPILKLITSFFRGIFNIFKGIFFCCSKKEEQIVADKEDGVAENKGSNREEDVLLVTQQNFALLSSMTPEDEEGSIGAMREKIKEGLFNIQTKNEGGFFPLHIAAQRGLLKVVQMLLASGANVGGQDQMGCTPLQWVLRKIEGDSTCDKQRYFEIGVQLLEHGADPNSRARYKSALHFAIENQSRPFFNKLLSKGANVNAEIPNIKLTPLGMAVQCSATAIDKKPLLQMARLLIERGANINARMSISHCILHGAIINGWDEFIDQILALAERNSTAVDLDVKDSMGFTPVTYLFGQMMKASQEDQVKFLGRVNQFIIAGADVNVSVDALSSLIHLVVEKGIESTFRLMIEKKVDVNVVNGLGLTPLVIALEKADKSGNAEDQKKYLAIAKMLIEAGATTNRSTSFREPIQELIQRNRWQQQLGIIT